MKASRRTAFLAVALLGVAAPSGADDAAKSDGAALYAEHCAVCHQANGSGVPFMQPPLRSSERANGAKGSVIDMILYGSDAEGAGNSEYSNTMPAFDYFSNEDIAAIATYVRTHFKNNGGVVTADDVHARRKE